MSIMTFEKYFSFMEDAMHKMDALNRKIDYRKIQLVGRNEFSLSYLMNGAKSSYSDEEDAILKNDEVLNSLHIQKEQLQSKINYVTKWGKLPLDADAVWNRIFEDQNKEM